MLAMQLQSPPSGGVHVLLRKVPVVSASDGEKGVHGFIVPDGVVGPQADPLGDGTVLLLGLGQLDLGPETLVALFVMKKCDGQPSAPVN